MQIDLVVITIETLIAVVLGGVGMGVYLACATKCGYTPSLTTLLVLGWSFLVPLGVTQVLTHGDSGVDIQRVIERMVLWAIFSIHARVGVKLYSRFLADRRACKSEK